MKILKWLSLGVCGLALALSGVWIGVLGVSETHAITACDASIPQEIRAATGCEDSGAVSDLPQVIQNILNAIILVAGTVAVVFIVVGGINYMTSSGDASKVELAKRTILYACIGLIVCALAFAIVNFVVNIVNNSTKSSSDEGGDGGEAYIVTPEDHIRIA